MRINRKIIIIFALVLLMLITVFYCVPRYGWWLFGFKYCTDPVNLIFENLSINGSTDIIEIDGNTTESAPAFIGAVYRVEGTTLYVGIKYNTLFGFFDRSGKFYARIQTETDNIEKIVLKGGQSEKTIYVKGGPQPSELDIQEAY